MTGLLFVTGGNATEEGQGEAIQWLPNGVPEATELGIALVVLVIGWFLSKLVVRLAGRTVARRIERPSVTRTVLRGVRASVLLATLTVVAAILGFSGTSILLSVTVISAVVAVVLAPLVGSFINGLFVLADQPYEIGDMIEVTDAGHRGFVEDITIRYTKIFTLENTFIVIPNSEIQQRDVVNYSAEDERTRLSITFEVTYESDLDAARRGAARAAREVDNVISGGPAIRIGSARYAASPTCFVAEYAESGILLELYVWLQHPYNQARDLSAVRDAVRERLQSLDVEFAYPHRHHVFDETSGVPALTGTGDVDSAVADSSPGSGSGTPDPTSDSTLDSNPDSRSNPNPDPDPDSDPTADSSDDPT